MWGVALSLLLVCIFWKFKQLIQRWWLPARAVYKQQIRGPVFGRSMNLQSLKLRLARRSHDLHAASHDIVEHVNPQHVNLSKQYGKIGLPFFAHVFSLLGVPYCYWSQNELTLVVDDPEIVRQVLSKKASSTGRSPQQQKGILNFLGRGLLSVNGDEWSHHRRVVSPAFHLEKVKNMTRAFITCSTKMFDGWEKIIAEGNGEVDVSEELTKLTADIISHTAFGSNYDKGRKVFQNQTLIVRLLTQRTVGTWLPFGSSLVPTQLNRTIWRLRKEINQTLLQLIKERRDSFKFGNATSLGNDLLGMMLQEIEDDNSQKFGDSELIGECKTFYLAGHETTASLLTWTIYLLAIYPEWQERARQEVFHTCKGATMEATYDPDKISRMRLVAMILNETLRLYPPAVSVTRGCFEDIQAGELFIAKGTSIEIPVLAMHHDEKLWGPDVHQFNPERFANGASMASKHPNGFMPFSFGPRVCVGQTFAVMEAKCVLAILLSRFSFALSHGYRHCPTLKITLKPHHGMNILLTRL